MTPRRVVFSVLVCCAFGCAGRWERIDLTALPAARSDGDVVLLDETEVVFSPGASGEAQMEIRERRRVRAALRSSTRGERLFAAYLRGFSSVTSLRGRVVNPDGSAFEADPKKSVDVPMSGESLYDDVRVIALPLPAVAPGGIVETESVVRQGQPRLFQAGKAFGGREPRTSERLIVRAPAGWRIDWLARDEWKDLTFEPETSEADGERRWVWSRSSPGNDDGDDAPDLRVSIRLASWEERGQPQQGFTDAKALSAWLFERIEPSRRVTPELRAKAVQLLKTSATAHEKARLLYEFVAQQVRYCAIEVGLGGWIPHASDSVLRLGYGDCKDKANLLRTLLEQAGIASRLALVYAHRGMPVRFGLPVLAANFNHMILIVDLPDGSVVCDPTARSVPFGELPDSDLDAELLPLTKEGSPLVRAPAGRPRDDGTTETYELSVEPSGLASGRFELAASGTAASRLAQGWEATRPDEQQRLVEDWLALSAPKVSELRFERAARPVLARGEVQVAQLMRGAGDVALLQVDELAPTPVRRSLARLDRARVLPPVGSQRLEVALTLPKNMEVSTLPEDVSIEHPNLAYRLHLERTAQGVRLTRQLEIRDRVVPPSARRALEQALQQVHAAEARAAVIRLHGGTP